MNLRALFAVFLAPLVIASGCQSVAPKAAPTSPPSVQKADLLDGLWALTTLESAITVEDVMQKLDLNANDLDIRPPDDTTRMLYGWENYISWKDKNVDGSHPVRAIQITRVLPPQPWEPFSRQYIWIYLSKDAACTISTESVGARLHKPYETQHRPGFADVGPATLYVFHYQGEKTTDGLTVEPKCTRRVVITKYFLPPEKGAFDFHRPPMTNEAGLERTR